MKNLCGKFRSSSFGMGGVMDKQAEGLLGLKFKRLNFRIRDLSPIFKRVSEKFRQEIGFQFTSEGSHGGHAWAPLKPATVRDRINKGYGGEHPILVRTGRLRDSLRNEQHRDACGGITARSFLIGTQVDYAKYHQSKLPRRKLPRRAFMVITNQFRLTVVRLIHRFVVKGEIG
jgi:phage gpG-like protein